MTVSTTPRPSRSRSTSALRRWATASAVAALLIVASIGAAAGAGGNGATFCSESTRGFNPGSANLEHVPPGPGGLPEAVGVFAPVATSFCNPTGMHPSDPRD